VGIWIRILSFVNISANSFVLNEGKTGNCNRRLYRHYLTLAPELPYNFTEMKPLFSAVICGCNAGLFREALHEVYIPRIQRGDTYFAANVLGARGPLLSALVHFFEKGRWGSPVASRGKALRQTTSSTFSWRPGPVALFARDRQADGNPAGCPTYLLAGTGAK
jgi:hypothetical protein